MRELLYSSNRHVRICGICSYLNAQVLRDTMSFEAPAGNFESVLVHPLDDFEPKGRVALIKISATTPMILPILKGAQVKLTTVQFHSIRVLFILTHDLLLLSLPLAPQSENNPNTPTLVLLESAKRSRRSFRMDRRLGV
jgi:hypothetical protein